MTNEAEQNHQNEDSNEASEETLAERSARLEKEAAGMNTEDETATDETDEDVENYYSDDDSLNVPDSNVETLALQKQLDDAKDKMIRAVAEAENTRRRAQKERADASKYAISSFSKDLLSVADNLRRALEAVPEDLLNEHEPIKNLVNGIEATEREMLRAFEKNGIQKVTPDLANGETFDPNKHEVMFEAPGTGQPAGTIIQVVEPGYMLHDRLIRPARVGVAKAEEGTAPPSSGATHIDTEA